MLVRILIPTVAAILFLLESEFAMFSPMEFNGGTYFLIPRFVVLYLIFLAIYYDRKKAMIYGLILGLCFDVFYINIIGLYTFLYPAVCFIAGWCMKRIHPHLLFSTVLAILLISFLEFAIYEFFYMIQFTTMALKPFLLYRLMPTILANLLFLVMLGWVFKYLIRARVLQRAQ
ncbi:rod shape-determining protein MreD [Lysinibacillus sp. 2017]|uniref:rod shape-determining protein MreD n=1 Tax=unclassified Lysinibacillus TaxID=2636778 RepID=UPI000D528FE3|nr:MULTISPECIES: rod shape-determining protein MreD [unclassified Lysinibacillus]AWE08174.1 rod shape-determining protein MreD [Lysinibacillus sp. 2017]TGN36322.1 rod shape-determining protein MreD [Lysinibacillus sp. S2017]